MFWGIVAKSEDGPHPIFISEDKSLALSSIVLDTSTLTEGQGPHVVSVYVKVSGRSEFLIAVLTKENPNHNLALEFDASDEIAFLVKGPEGASAHITGNILDEEEGEYATTSGSDEESAGSWSSMPPVKLIGPRQSRRDAME
jgi:hypothetical protein